MEDNTPPVKKHKSTTRNSTPAAPVRLTRLRKEAESVVNECENNVRSLRARKKTLLMQFTREAELLDEEVIINCVHACMIHDICF